MMNFLTINDLLTSDRLPEEQMRLLLINSTDIAPDSERRAIANTILETAGDFLPTRDLMPFIKADISRKEAGDIILSQKKFIKGAAALFPEIVRLLGLSRIEDVKPVLHQIVDVCLDYPNILKSSHPKKRKRELAKSAHEVCQMIDSLNNALAQLDWHLDIEFSNHKAAQKRLFGPEFAAISHIWQLRNEISDLRFVAKLALLR